MLQPPTYDIRYRDFFEEVPVGLFAVSPDGYVLDANPAMVRILRYPDRETLLGANLKDFQPDGADAARAIASLHERGEVLNQEVQFGRPDNTTAWLLISARAARDRAGTTLYYHGSVEDITERKRAEEAARDSELRFEAFMNHMPVVAFIKDEEGRYEYANEPCLRFFNKQREELYGRTDYDLFSRNIADPLRAHDLAVVRESTGLQTVERFQGPDGEPRSFMVLKFLITDPNERNFVGGFALDITDRERAEEAELRNEKRFRDLFESSPEAIFVHDLEGNILDVNPGACALYGQSVEELVGAKITGLLPTEKLAEILTNLGRHARGGVAHAEAIISAHDGTATPVDISASRIEYSGEPALLLHVRDMSEQKRLQEQFYQSQKMEAIGRLAGGIAHDFNNLLTAIIGYNELILLGLNDQDPLKNSSDEVKKAAERAARLTRQLLAVSRNQALQPRIVDLNASVTDIERMLRRMIGDDIELTTITCPGRACVKADASQLEQVLINLAVNARDAMPMGGQLFVRLSSVTLGGMNGGAPDLPPGQYVVLRVTDTGTGMSEEIRGRIFEPFFTTKEPGKGTGLGLATCYGIVKQSGGRIICESTLGRGTTFSIYLPQVMGTPEVAKTDAPAPLPRGTEKILIVEDAAGVRNLAARILGSLGYQVLLAENGFDALNVISKHGLKSIDLILTDVTMPKMGGQELVERVRGTNPETKVVFTSGAPGADLALKALFTEPCTAFLHKPFTPADLARVVRHVINMPRNPGAAPNGAAMENGALLLPSASPAFATREPRRQSA